VTGGRSDGTTDARHQWKLWPNLARNLIATTVNQLWSLTLLTFDWTRRLFIWRCLDAFQSQGGRLGDGRSLAADLALAALEMALAQRAVTPVG